MNGSVEEIRNSTRNKMTMTHARAYGMSGDLEPCQPLSQYSVRTSEQGKTVKGR